MQSKNMSVLRILGILLWKKWLERMSAWYWRIPLEILLPSALFILMFSLRGFLFLMDQQKSMEKENVQLNEAFSLDSPHLHTDLQLVLYTPETNITRKLMDEVGRRLDLYPLYDFDHNARGIYPFSKDTLDMTPAFVKKMRESTAIVVFNDMDPKATELPKKFNYTIRMKTDFMTHVYQSLDDDTSPHARFGAIYEPFMRLQWAIDASYINRTTGQDYGQAISLQEFPYADNRINKSAATIATMINDVAIISVFFSFYIVFTNLVAERSGGQIELIKMCGVSKPLYMAANFINMLPMGVIFGLSGAIFTTVSSNPLLKNTSPILLFIVFLLYYMWAISFASATSYIISNPRFAGSLGFFIFVVCTRGPELALGERSHKLPYPVFLLTMLLPNQAFNRWFEEVGNLETYDKGATFANMLVRHHRLSTMLCIVFLLVTIALWLLLTWYMTLVRPGPLGVALPWNFCCQFQKKKVNPDEMMDEEYAPMVQDKKYFQPPPHGAHVGISVNGVSKLFGNRMALSNVSFDVYQGEIAVLLGHNGAGKTTVMSIITGLYSPTSGTVQVSGEEVRRGAGAGAGAVRVGFCPQKQVLFDKLNVIQHAMFFALLRGFSYKEAKESSQRLLEEVGLEHKANSKASKLSGGMQRRMQLVCALAGNADVLILDEPTSGLDVETRRELWDLILSLRESRTVLLSTHFMEEADALGDRVVALHNGQLRCHATPMHLKKSIGTGYRLSLTTVGSPKDDKITSFITRSIPDAVLKEKTYNSVSYMLPAENSAKFPKLFADLENSRSELGVDSIGVGVSTLEEVFLKLCSDTIQLEGEDVVDGEEPTYTRLSGPRLLCRQFIALIKRQISYLWSTKYSFIIMQVVLPILLLVGWSYATAPAKGNVAKMTENQPTAMDLNIYKDIKDRNVLYRVTNTSDLTSILDVANRNKKVKFTAADDISEAVLRAGTHDYQQYNNYLVGIELNGSDAKVLYTTVVRHAAPVGLNLLTNILATRAGGEGGRRRGGTPPQIIANNAPLIASLTSGATVMPMNSMEATVWITFVIIMALIVLANAYSFMRLEMRNQTRHLHIMAGCSPYLHCAATIIFRLLLCTVTFTIPAILCVYFDTQNTLTQPSFIMAMFLLFMVGVLSFLILCYDLSFFPIIGSTALVLVGSILGVVPGIIRTYADIFELKLSPYIKFPLTILKYVSPLDTWTSAALKICNVASVNALCEMNRENQAFCLIMSTVSKQPAMKMFGTFDAHKCCVEKINPASYYSLEKDSAGPELVIMVVQIVVMIGIFILFTLGVSKWLGAKLLSDKEHETESDNASTDDMVRAERTYVRKAADLPPSQTQDSLLVNNVYKNYNSGFCKKLKVVKGVSFSVAKGECFGILGVNGAGKTTLFKTITAQCFPSQGKIIANGNAFNKPMSKYLDSLSYCPQFCGVDEFLTGRSSMQLVLTLRGHDDVAVDKLTDNWIHIVGLEKHQNVSVGGYSGGCQRRLSAAAALSGGAAVALLDEPTSGVDVGARRKVWTALKRGLHANRSIIVTSHSMDEMEALCSRIAIMAGGRVAALGSAAALRAQHAAGHAVIIKINTPTGNTDEPDGANALASLKGHLQESFNCTLRDEHKTMLHYHINETMRYSELFESLEALKQQYPDLIEDYSVTETTLEEVFLSFAQASEEGERARQPEERGRNGAATLV